MKIFYAKHLLFTWYIFKLCLLPPIYIGKQRKL
jgi:hypothetical protein